MLTRWRRILAWTLLLWLPLHGGTALALGLCASMQGQASPMAASAHADCAGHMASDMAPDSAAVPAVADHDGTHDSGPCVHCAACQVHAAALPAVPALSLAVPPALWIAATPLPLAERAPEALERPPRTTLA